MAERPIIMSGQSVPRIFDGTKTVTRRVVKPQPEFFEPDSAWWHGDGHSGTGWYVHNTEYPDEGSQFYRCPFGAVGDRLHIGEALIRVDDGNGYPYAVYERTNETVFEANGLPVKWRWKVKKLTSMYCPKAYRRIWLEVLSVRVERVQAITARGVRAEGVACPEHDFAAGFCVGDCGHLGSAFRDLWDSINAKRGFGWDANPWVWVVEFKMVEGSAP